ncbi:MAG: hypothetical protein LE169_00395 [Endomicrobium sp.]|nr:hypothetical protein [Endomicrobium sp.]
MFPRYLIIRESLNEIAGKCKMAPKMFIAENSILDRVAFLKKCSLFVMYGFGCYALTAVVGARCI